MRAVVQRVRSAEVTVSGRTVGHIGPGLLVLVGAEQGDGAADADWIADKVVHLRVFEDDDGKMNRSVVDIRGAVLAVSQFTLLGDCRKGRRPSFVAAMEPVAARGLFDRCVEAVARAGIPVGTGEFGARMEVALVNDGPVTLLLDSRKRGPEPTAPA